MADKQVLKIGHMKITDHLILGVTKDKLDKGKEIFQHCSIETVAKTGWNEVDQGLCDGSLDAAFILAPMAMDTFKSGIGIKLVLLGHKNGSVFIKSKKANISKIEDFKGKTVIIPYQLSIHHLLLHKMLTEKGLSCGAGKDVMLEVFAPSQIAEAMEYDEEGEIGGFIVAEPFGSQVIKLGYGEEFCLSKQLWPNHPCCVFVVKDDVLANNENAVYELVKSLNDSGQFITNNPKEAAKIGAEFLSQDVDVIERVLSNPVDRVKTSELMPVIEDLDKIQEYMTSSMGVMRSKIDMTKLVELKFAKAAGAK